MIGHSITAAVIIGAIALAGVSLADDRIATLRGADIADTPRAPTMTPMVDSNFRQVRNYPEQPPLIPHKIDGYQIDRNANKCLTCHSRTAIEDSQAPMVSITHFMDREGQFLASVSPRRYFCTQCHVPQHDAREPVGNTFVDVDTLLRATE